MHFKIALTSFFLLTSVPCSPNTTTEPLTTNQKYIQDKKGRILILRKELIGGELFISSCITMIGLAGLYACLFSKNISNEISLTDKILLGIGSPLLTIFGIILFQKFHHDYKHQDDPLIILDKTGIWNETWDQKIFWFNIQDITFIETHEIVNDNGFKYDKGFFWIIEIKTKQQESFFIDERDTLMGTSNRRFDINAGGELGQLILKHYNKYKIMIHKNKQKSLR